MIDEIIIQNPWWKTGSVDKSRLCRIRRSEFNSLKRELSNKKVLCLLGPRRAGKTTLMYEMINFLLKKDTDPKRILYISFDSSKIRLEMKRNFDGIIQEYINSLVREPVDKLTSEIYIFFDEIHKLEDWGNKIKFWQDLGLKIKFVVSGSSSIRILKGSGESLLGRISFHMILPLKFSEFVGKASQADFTDFEQLKEAYNNVMLDKQEITVQLEDYILKGGFPEVYYIKDIEKAYEILRQYKTLTITRDILDMKDIKEPGILLDLIDLLTDFMGGRINYSTFAKTLGIKVDTAKKYISYLVECFLIYTTYFYSEKQVLSTRKEKKLFFIDVGLRNSLLLKPINDLEKSKIIENLVFFHVFSLKRNELFPKIFYWFDKNKNEVDIIVNIGKKIIPIEVKYREQIGRRDLRGLLKFMEEFNIEKGIVVTKNLLEKRTMDKKEIIFIPAWLFLLSSNSPSN